MDNAPGRTCPLHYRYPPAVFHRAPPPDLAGLEVLYVVGGLYGSTLALEAVQAMFARERGAARLVFNGDFHWFDVDPADFATVQRGVMAHRAMRGNVETELADPPAAGAPDPGCGCAYPDWVGDGVVERSNRILTRLRGATDAAHRAALAALPMTLRADVAGLRVGLVHGDGASLAGWGFAAEHLRERPHRRAAAAMLDAANVDAFACSHTCLPVLRAFGDPRPGAAPGARRWVLNNGAAGLPNFRGDPCGLLIRIATTPFAGPQRHWGVRERGAFIDAVAIEVDAAAARARFLATWPPGSDAHTSYFDRLANGPAHTPADLIHPTPDTDIEEP